MVSVSWEYFANFQLPIDDVNDLDDGPLQAELDPISPLLDHDSVNQREETNDAVWTKTPDDLSMCDDDDLQSVLEEGDLSLPDDWSIPEWDADNSAAADLSRGTSCRDPFTIGEINQAASQVNGNSLEEQVLLLDPDPLHHPPHEEHCDVLSAASEFIATGHDMLVDDHFDMLTRSPRTASSHSTMAAGNSSTKLPEYDAQCEVGSILDDDDVYHMAWSPVIQSGVDDGLVEDDLELTDCSTVFDTSSDESLESIFSGQDTSSRYLPVGGHGTSAKETGEDGLMVDEDDVCTSQYSQIGLC